MGKVVKGLLGAVGLGGEDAPKVSNDAASSTEADARKAKASRSALFETQGGVAGSELNPDEVNKKKTLLGN